MPVFLDAMFAAGVLASLCTMASAASDPKSQLCSLVLNLRVGAVSPNQATLTWDNSGCLPMDAPLSFEVDLRSKMNKKVAWTNTTVFGPTTTTLTSLQPDTNYSVSILPHMGTKMGAEDYYSRSAVVYFVTPLNGGAVSPPTSSSLCKLVLNLKASAVSPNQATLTWGNSNCQTADAPLSFEVDLRSKMNGKIAWTNMTVFGMTTTDLPGLQPGTNYSVSILPHMGTKTGAEDYYARSDVVYFTTPLNGGAIPPPTSSSLCKLVLNLKVSAVSLNQATLTWSNSNCLPADAPLSFEVDLRSKMNGKVAWTNTTAFGMTTTNLTGLQPGTNYSVSILPHMGTKMGAEDFYARSDVVYFTTPVNGAIEPSTSSSLCKLVLNLKVGSVTANQAVLSWTNGGCMAYDVGLSYEVDLRKKANKQVTWTNTTAFGPTSYSLTALTPASNYSVSILPHMGTQQGPDDEYYARSDVVYFKTPRS